MNSFWAIWWSAMRSQKFNFERGEQMIVSPPNNCHVLSNIASSSGHFICFLWAPLPTHFVRDRSISAPFLIFISVHAWGIDTVCYSTVTVVCFSTIRSKAMDRERFFESACSLVKKSSVFLFFSECATRCMIVNSSSLSLCLCMILNYSGHHIRLFKSLSRPVVRIRPVRMERESSCSYCRPVINSYGCWTCLHYYFVNASRSFFCFFV